MDADYLAVPMWLVKFAVLGGLGIGVKAILDLRSLRQLLIGYDGKNGIRGDLQLLDATVEDLGRELRGIHTQVEVDAERIEQLERERGLAA
jgi:hypothetical protein